MKKLVSLLLSIMLTISMTTNMAFAGNRVDSTVEEAVMYNSDGEELKFKLKKLSDDQYKMELLVSGVHDPVLSGATNRFLSENRKPIDRIS